MKTTRYFYLDSTCSRSYWSLILNQFVMLKLCINYGMSALGLDGKWMCWFLWNIGTAENSFRLTGSWSFAMPWTYSLIYYRHRLRIPFPAMYSRGVRSEPRRDAYKEACMGPAVWAGSHVVADQEGYHLLEDSCHSLVDREGIWPVLCRPGCLQLSNRDLVPSHEDRWFRAWLTQSRT